MSLVTADVFSHDGDLRSRSVETQGGRDENGSNAAECHELVGAGCYCCF